MRLATFNLLHGRSVADGQVRQLDLVGAAADLDADVVGLQEVDRGQDRSGGADQTAVAAAALGAAHWRFVPTLEGVPGGAWTASGVDDGSTVIGPAYGIGLVSRWPVRSWHVRRFGPAPVAMPLLVPGSKGLTRVDDEPRVAVGAVLDTPSGRLTVVTTHLSFVPGWNVAQLRAIAGWARTLPGPRVLLGDFNLPGAVPRLATRWTQAVRIATYPSWRPRVQFDHVLLDGVSLTAVAGGRSIRTAISDHCALVVDLQAT
ncbi:MAG: endonuclease/exonuclease/phosphatase family protein [Sporichthyaceae bacterium]|nr:endonuclease/exonuclease/phosphatase family protein [Sporichthyaceae bacterium]